MTARIGAATWRAIDVALQTYADALDRADLGALLSVFAEDAEWEYRPEAPLRGRAAIERSFAGIGVFAQTSHHVGPPVVSPGPRPGTYDSWPISSPRTSSPRGAPTRCPEKSRW
jgi:hypothetical protein